LGSAEASTPASVASDLVKAISSHHRAAATEPSGFEGDLTLSIIYVYLSDISWKAKGTL